VTADIASRVLRPRIALALGGAALVLLAATVPLAAVAHQLTAGAFGQPLLMAPYAAVGTLVAARRPANPVGWLLLALALASLLGVDAGFYGVRAYRVDHHDLPLSRVAVFLTQGWAAMLVLLPVPIVLFPDGRPPSHRWRWTLYAYAVVAATFVGSLAYRDLGAFTDRPVVVDSSGELKALGANPSGILGIAAAVLVIAYASIAVSWVVAQIRAYRRSAGDRHEQLKWLLAGSAASVIGIIVAVVFGATRSPVLQILSGVGFVALAALPLSIGIGILRYRLYEIDRLISRTLSYALLTGLLVGTFAGLVLLTTRVLPFSSPVGVAASTLVAVLLANPLRSRLQRLVDRRFNRARYDADLLVAAFAARLRTAVDVDAVLEELVAATGRSVEPSHISVWVSGRRTSG
jgi:hypothetical protein